jgi:glycosyltransferase involved in cell wall biosynthesis
VAIEASIGGAAVVMSDTGCAGEIIVDGMSGQVLPAPTPRPIAAAIRTYLDDENLRKTHAANAKKLCARKLDPETLRKRLIAFLRG